MNAPGDLRKYGSAYELARAWCGAGTANELHDAEVALRYHDMLYTTMLAVCEAAAKVPEQCWREWEQSYSLIGWAVYTAPVHALRAAVAALEAQ